MTKHLASALIIALLIFSSLSISKVRFLDDILYPGDELDVLAVIANRDTGSANDVRVLIDFPELGDSINGGRVDIASADHHSRVSTWNVPRSIMTGEYLVRIIASNDDGSTRAFRRIVVD